MLHSCIQICDYRSFMSSTSSSVFSSSSSSTKRRAQHRRRRRLWSTPGAIAEDGAGGSSRESAGSGRQIDGVTPVDGDHRRPLTTSGSRHFDSSRDQLVITDHVVLGWRRPTIERSISTPENNLMSPSGQRHRTLDNSGNNVGLDFLKTFLQWKMPSSSTSQRMLSGRLWNSIPRSLSSPFSSLNFEVFVWTTLDLGSSNLK